MNEDSLAGEIIRLQKLDLDANLRAKLEEAARLMAEGNHLEAEALVQNADARIRQSREREATGTPGRINGADQPVSPLAG